MSLIQRNEMQLDYVVFIALLLVSVLTSLTIFLLLASDEAEGCPAAVQLQLTL